MRTYAELEMLKSFEGRSETEIERHCKVARYGNFTLTEAIRPAYDKAVIPTQGYKRDHYVDQVSHWTCPVLMASVSREILFEVFMELIDPLGKEVDLVLETSHGRHQAKHTDLYRHSIDMPVLKSMLWDYEDLLLNDGCTGIAVLNPSSQQEVQFDEHKLLVLYNNPLDEFEDTFKRFGVKHDPEMRIITEAEHIHVSSQEFERKFQEMATDFGLDA